MSRIIITNVMRDELRELRKSTGIAPMRLLKGRSDVPEGLDSAIIQSWLNGKTESARLDHYKFVLKVWRQVTPRIRLSDEDRELLRTEMARTGVGPKAILRLLPSSPHKLKPIMISNWVNGKLETASAAQWEAVLSTYRSLPNLRS